MNFIGNFSGKRWISEAIGVEIFDSAAGADNEKPVVVQFSNLLEQLSVMWDLHFRLSVVIFE